MKRGHQSNLRDLSISRGEAACFSVGRGEHPWLPVLKVKMLWEGKDIWTAHTSDIVLCFKMAYQEDPTGSILDKRRCGRSLEAAQAGLVCARDTRPLNRLIPTHTGQRAQYAALASHSTILDSQLELHAASILTTSGSTRRVSNASSSSDLDGLTSSVGQFQESI